MIKFNLLTDLRLNWNTFVNTLFFLLQNSHVKLNKLILNYFIEYFRGNILFQHFNYQVKFVYV